MTAEEYYLRGNEARKQGLWHEAINNYNDTLKELAYKCVNSQIEIMNLYADENQSINSIQEAIDNSLDICQNALNQANTLGDRE